MTEKLRCGLIGKPLGHSYSPQIHARLGSYEYRLIELEENEVGPFIKSDEYDAVNVTIPYKKTVMPFLDVISGEAERIGSVNTVTHLPDGRIRGDNTDYFGFLYMLRRAGINPRGKKVLVLGSGGASMTARTVAGDCGAREVVIISRGGENNYTNLSLHSDAEVIINTTPVGMYPNNGEKPLSLDIFPSLVGVVDMIYNPSKTALILDAEEKNIPCSSGLCMLVAQAKLASEYFTGEMTERDTADAIMCEPGGIIDEIVYEIEKDTKNIMLTGMPGVGKTTMGRRIAQKLNREFVDIDEEIVKKSGTTIPEIFAAHGEEYFRSLEHDTLAEFSKKSGLVISCGGGTVIRHDNIRLMKENSRVVFLRRDLSLLPKDGRPVSQANDLGELYKRRLPFYLEAADIVFDMGEREPEENAELILKEITK